MKVLPILLLTLASASLHAEGPAPATTPPEIPPAPAGLYRKTGEDPTFEELLAQGRIQLGKNSKAGVTGSRIEVGPSIIGRAENRAASVPAAICIHTLCHSAIQRKDFPKWTRWYQEDGGTQVFRLFKGECNVRNARKGAARIEAFSRLSWKHGAWHEWRGTFTIVHPHVCSIFQVKNSLNDWAVMINLSDSGDITLNHRRHAKDQVLARGMTGKSFDLKVRDNGRDYEVFFNGRKAGEGFYDRPAGDTAFRWGMYDGTVKHDAMIFVSGAAFE